MRSRKEIEAEIAQGDVNGISYDQGVACARLQVIEIELLLDIRDILNKKKRKKP